MATTQTTRPPRVSRGAFRFDTADFATWLRTERPAKAQVTTATATRYGTYATEFCRLYGDPRQATPEIIARWRDAIRTVSRTGKTAAPQTINLKIAALRGFFGYLVARGYRADDPTTGLVMQRVPESQRAAIPKETLTQLFDALYAAQPTAEVLQDRALAEILYGSGLRREETAVLVLSDIEERETVRVRRGKGGKGRRSLLTGPGYEAVRAWALVKLGDDRTTQLRAEISDDAAFDDLRRRMPEAPLFYSVTGAALPTLTDPGNFVWRRAKAWLGALNVEGTTHEFRHSFFSHLLDGGMDLLAVADMGGHASVSTTRRYRTASAHTFARARSLHPRG